MSIENIPKEREDTGLRLFDWVVSIPGGTGFLPLQNMPPGVSAVFRPSDQTFGSSWRPTPDRCVTRATCNPVAEVGSHLQQGGPSVGDRIRETVAPGFRFLQHKEDRVWTQYVVNCFHLGQCRTSNVIVIAIDCSIIKDYKAVHAE